MIGRIIAFMFFMPIAIVGLIISVKFMWATMGIWLAFLLLGLLVVGVRWLIQRTAA